jgi:hypothetical protein
MTCMQRGLGTGSEAARGRAAHLIIIVAFPAVVLSDGGVALQVDLGHVETGLGEHVEVLAEETVRRWYEGPPPKLCIVWMTCMQRGLGTGSEAARGRAAHLIIRLGAGDRQSSEPRPVSTSEMACQAPSPLLSDSDAPVARRRGAGPHTSSSSSLSPL